MPQSTIFPMTALLGAAFLFPQGWALADDAPDPLELAELDELASGLELNTGVMDTSIEHELFSELSAHHPSAAKAWPDLTTVRQAELVKLYRDSGHLPTIASEVVAKPVPID